MGVGWHVCSPTNQLPWHLRHWRGEARQQAGWLQMKGALNLPICALFHCQSAEDASATTPYSIHYRCHIIKLRPIFAQTPTVPTQTQDSASRGSCAPLHSRIGPGSWCPSAKTPPTCRSRLVTLTKRELNIRMEHNHRDPGSCLG